MMDYIYRYLLSEKSKIQTLVEFPIYDLDLSEFELARKNLDNVEEQRSIYDLVAVSVRFHFLFYLLLFFIFINVYLFVLLLFLKKKFRNNLFFEKL